MLYVNGVAAVLNAYFAIVVDRGNALSVVAAMVCSVAFYSLLRDRLSA